MGQNEERGEGRGGQRKGFVHMERDSQHMKIRWGEGKTRRRVAEHTK